MLPRSWNGQMLLLGFLLLLQASYFFFYVLLPSPIFDAPVTDRWGPGGTTTDSSILIDEHGNVVQQQPLSWLERIRWRLDTWRTPAHLLTPPTPAEAEALGTMTPVSSISGHPLPPLPLSDQGYFHTHSRNAFSMLHSFRNHIFMAKSRADLMQHLQEDSIYQTDRFQPRFETRAQSATKKQTVPDTSQGDPSFKVSTRSSEKPATEVQKPAAAVAASSSPSSTPNDKSFTSAFEAILRNWDRSDIRTECNVAMGSEMVRHWDATRQVFCDNPNAKQDESRDDTVKEIIEKALAGGVVSNTPPPGRFVCRSKTIDHMPPPTAPHSYCSASNVFIDLSTFSPADAPRHRAGYVMGKGNHYHFQDKRSFTSNCALTPQRNIGLISADHQRDAVEAFGGTNFKQDGLWADYIQKLQTNKPSVDMALHPKEPYSGDSKTLTVFPHTLLVITRENGEHCNYYHTMTDFWNAYLMMHAFSLKRENTQILFLDNHGPSPFDSAWQKVFSGAGKVLKANELINAGLQQSTIFAGGAVFSPPGYSSPLYRFLYEDSVDCASKVDLFPDFARFFLDGFGITFQRWTRGSTLQSIAGIDTKAEKAAFRQTYVAPGAQPSQSASENNDGVLHILFVSRKPYDLFVSHHKISRQIFNEDILLDFMTKSDPKTSNSIYHNVRVDIVDLARITMQQQLSLVASSDILVGMHGAALSHTLFLPPWGALLELHPQAQRWMCFKHQTEWSGHKYFMWRNNNLRAEREDATGTGIDVDPEEFKRVFDQAIVDVRARRQTLETEAMKRAN